MFRLPWNLTIGGRYSPVTLEDVQALEAQLPPGSRILVGVVFERRYEGFEADCERAEEELRKKILPSTWPEYPRLVTPDPDGESVAWISYLSSPPWWPGILGILAGIFLLPIIGILPFWVIEKIFPGITQFIMMVMVLLVLGGVMFILPKLKGRSELEEGK